jgi:teichuronic acid biosynthesis glycosyltransferase TuaG
LAASCCILEIQANGAAEPARAPRGTAAQTLRRARGRQLLKNTAIATVTGMADTVKTGPLRMTEARRDDYILWLSILKRGFVAEGLQEDLARYRVVKGSLSSKPKRSAAWVWKVYRQIEGLGPLRSAWCMAHYGTRAILKRLVF